METSLHNDANKGKRKGSTLDRDVNKRQKVEDRQDLDFLTLPNEIIHQIAQSSEALAALLLNLTCKRIYRLLNFDNCLWHAIYLDEQQIRNPWIPTKAFIDNTVLGDAHAMGAYAWERESESLNFEGQYPLTADCLDFANDIISDEDKSYREYRPLLVGRDGDPWLQFPAKDMSFSEYADSVNYKKLALQSWKRYYQYQFWSSQKKCARLWKYKHCSCFELSDLQMTNEREEKITIEDTDEDEFASHSDDVEEDQEISADNEPTNHNSLTEEICSSFIEEISAINDLNFKLFAQLLDGVILGHCASPGCKHSYQIRVAKLLHKHVHLVGESVEIIFQQIRRVICNKNSFECMSSIVCALQKFSMADLLTLQDCVKLKFPYLATVVSILDIEESIPYFWITWMEYATAHWSFHIQPDLATVDAHNNMPDWLSIRHSMLKLMRRSGIFMATPNTSEYAVDALSSFIKRALEAVIELKPDGTNKMDVTATTIMQAVKSISKNKEYSTTTLYSTCAETMQDDLIVMHVDSEISSDDSDFDDPSEEDDLNENLIDNEVIEDEYNKIDDYQGLNELIKKSASGRSLDDDDTPLLMQTAVTYAQKDLTEGLMSDIIGEEDDSLEEQEYQAIVTQDDRFRHIDVFSPTDIDDVLKINRDNLVLFHQQEAKYYKHSLKDLPKEFNLDLPFNKRTDDQRTKIIELRRETNKILKEEADKELKEEQIRSIMRWEDNHKQYHDNLPDPLTCKSMEIKLNSTGATLRKTITDAIEIISNSKELKLVRLKWVWLEEREKESNDELYLSLLEALSKCSTLKTVELDDCHLDQKLIRNKLPKVTVKSC